ncbi:MAG: LuxR C-terminal-related transcriptional regulator [Hyphomicrobiales bacterium]|nr:LuxR C-terminal-related transcriptional regulator [Hyphomicrobiales bacterium]
MSIAHSRLPQDLSDLVGRIYDCTLDPRLWKTTLEEVSAVFEGKAVQFALTDIKRRNYLITENVGVDDAWMEAQQKHCRDIHYHEQRIRDNGLSMGEPMIFTRDIPPTLLETLPYFNEWSKPQGLVDFAHLNLVRSPNRVSFLGVFRHENSGVFSPRDIELLRFLIPHVRRAVTISNVLEAKSVRETRMAETLDALNLGVVLADEDSRILHANRSAEDMLRSNGPVKGVGGKLRAENASASAEIKSAIELATSRERKIEKKGIAVRLSDDCEAPVIAHVLPLGEGEPRTFIEPKAAAAVFISTPMDEGACVATLKGLYGLTVGEAKALAPILSGKTAPEAADELGVAVSTARTHLKNIYAKTNVTKQSELMKLAASVMPPVSEAPGTTALKT